MLQLRGVFYHKIFSPQHRRRSFKRGAVHARQKTAAISAAPCLICLKQNIETSPCCRHF